MPRQINRKSNSTSSSSPVRRRRIGTIPSESTVHRLDVNGAVETANQVESNPEEPIVEYIDLTNESDTVEPIKYIDLSNDDESIESATENSNFSQAAASLEGQVSPPRQQQGQQVAPSDEQLLKAIDLSQMGDFALDRAIPSFEFSTSTSRINCTMLDPDTNLERPFRIAGMIVGSHLTKEGTCADDPELSPIAALPRLELDLTAQTPKYFNADNDEKIANIHGMQSMPILEQHINDGRRALYGTTNAAPDNYRSPISETNCVRLTGDSIFMPGNGNFGINPTSLEKRADSLHLRYRYPGGVDPNLTITDTKGNAISDLGAGDFVIAEFVHRPYNFRSRSGLFVCGHKLRLLSVVRLKRRLVDVVPVPGRRNPINNSRILAATPMIFD